MRTVQIGIMLTLIAGLVGPVLAEDAVSPCASTGTVVSTVNSGPYTYVQLDIAGSNVWYAVPETKLKQGETVVAPAGLPMKDFYSKTLNRTFDMVYFADGINKVDSEKTPGSLPPGHPPIATGLPAGHPAILGMLPPGHPPVNSTTNSTCCAQTNESTDCCTSTNAAAQEVQTGAGSQ